MGLHDLDRHVNRVYEVMEQLTCWKRTAKTEGRVHLGYLKANVARFAFESELLREKKIDRKPDSVLLSFWKASRPKDQFAKGICDKTL